MISARRIGRFLFLPDAKPSPTALARLGRVCHWALAGLGMAVIAGSAFTSMMLLVRLWQFASTPDPYAIDVYPVTGADWAVVAVSAASAVVLALAGRALRYVLADE